MNIFKRIKKERVLIIGCGRFGSTLATLLSEENKNVAVIDIDETAFRKLSSSYGGFSIEGDGSDVDLLILAGIKETDVLIACTDDDDTNIMIAQMAKSIFNISKVIMRLYDTSKQPAFSNMDIVSICPSFLSIREYINIMQGEELIQA